MVRKKQILYMLINSFQWERWQTVDFKINSSKLYSAIAIMAFVIGAVAIYYSINLFLTNPNQTDNPKSFRVSHWSGYIAASDIQNRSPVVSSVSGSWTVPKIKPSENNTFSGVWVGIGGYGEETLIQTGTEQEYINSKSVYYAWYELLPDHLVRIPNIHVQAGDTVIASISLINENTNTWLIEIADITRDQRFKKVVVYNSSRLSAEWIVERPKVNGSLSTLADFTNVTFMECNATIEGETGKIGNFSYAQLVMHDQEQQLVTVSLLNNDGSSFTVNYLELPSATPVINNLADSTLHCMLLINLCNSHQLKAANRKIEVKKDFEGISNTMIFTS